MDLVKLLYEHFREERAKHVREEGVYWVTDLVACSLKSRFAREYPELELSGVFAPAAVLGSLVHAGLGQLLKQRLEAQGLRVELEVEASREIPLGEGGRAVVRGRADVVIETPSGSRIGVEVKTARADVSLPLEHHVDQLRIYNFLFGFERGLLLYVTPDRVAQYEVADRASEEEVARRITDAKAPRYAWECRYCPFAVLCPSKVRS